MLSKGCIHLFERQKQRAQESSNLLILSLNGHKGQGWARPEPEASSVSRGAEAQGPGSPFSAFSGTNRELDQWSGSYLTWHTYGMLEMQSVVLHAVPRCQSPHTRSLK